MLMVLGQQGKDIYKPHGSELQQQEAGRRYKLYTWSWSRDADMLQLWICGSPLQGMPEEEAR